MTKQTLRVETQLRMAKGAHEVFEAIVDPAKMSRYFISSGSGRLDTGAVLTWAWDDYGARAQVTPLQTEPDRSISFSWAASGIEAQVDFRLEPDGPGATIVRVSEAGWPADAQGIARCVEQTQGWMHMLCCMKAYLEHGIDLRRGGVVRAAKA